MQDDLFAGMEDEARDEDPGEVRLDGSESVVTVQLLTGLHKPLGYKVPGAMAGKVSVGSLVKVPLRQRFELAVVRSMENEGGFPEARLKRIVSLVQPHPVLTPDLIDMADWMSRYYACGIDQVFECMLPAAVRAGKGVKRRRLLRLRERLDDERLGRLKRRAPRQAALYEFLSVQMVPLERGMVLDRVGCGAPSAVALVEAGVIEEVFEQEEREAYSDELGRAERAIHAPVQLNEEQRAAADSLCRSMDSGSYAAHLLHGVTGSGKTEVYIEALRHAVVRGGSVLFLVPEVTLAPQTVARLRSRLGDLPEARCVVWHSNLSTGERYDSWHAVASGQVRVVVGARSALFAPVRNLRLVIVDEEHEPAYKQDETPRYHCRDAAVYRAHLAGATCVLGSATPSLESLHNARLGRYRLDRLTKRIDDRQLPVVHVVDMTREKGLGDEGPPLLSRIMREKLAERLERREQSILFINRRGYHKAQFCTACGHQVVCRHCSVSLAWHREENILRCHICGYETEPLKRCSNPECPDPRDGMRFKGHGTQRIEQIVQSMLPKARVARLDADVKARKNQDRKILQDFRKGDIDILVGTQMIAKGLDFPRVTLAGLVSADISLQIPDFRAAERTFQLLVQVSGRAGRGDRAGEVVVQTYQPSSAPIQYARRNDFDGFLEDELRMREEFHYPPFRHLVVHLFRGLNEDKVQFHIEQWAKLLEKSPVAAQIEIRGPAKAPFEKIKDMHRYQLWYFVPSASRVMPALVALRQGFPMDNEVSDHFDVDPVNLM